MSVPHVSFLLPCTSKLIPYPASLSSADIDEDDLALGDELAGWGSACPPDSSLRQLAHTFSPNLDETPLSPPEKETKSFVADLHEGLSDLCQNLEAVHLHGALNGVHPVPSAKLMPMFSLRFV